MCANMLKLLAQMQNSLHVFDLCKLDLALNDDKINRLRNWHIHYYVAKYKYPWCFHG